MLTQSGIGSGAKSCCAYRNKLWSKHVSRHVRKHVSAFMVGPSTDGKGVSGLIRVVKHGVSTIQLVEVDEMG